MGFIDFVKNAGSKIFGGGDDDATKAEAESTADANQAAATALKMRVQRLGLDEPPALGEYGLQQGPVLVAGGAEKVGDDAHELPRPCLTYLPAISVQYERLYATAIDGDHPERRLELVVGILGHHCPPSNARSRSTSACNTSALTSANDNER